MVKLLRRSVLGPVSIGNSALVSITGNTVLEISARAEARSIDLAKGRRGFSEGRSSSFEDKPVDPSLLECAEVVK